MQTERKKRGRPPMPLSEHDQLKVGSDCEARLDAAKYDAIAELRRGEDTEHFRDKLNRPKGSKGPNTRKEIIQAVAEDWSKETKKAITASMVRHCWFKYRREYVFPLSPWVQEMRARIEELKKKRKA